MTITMIDGSFFVLGLGVEARLTDNGDLSILDRNGDSIGCFARGCWKSATKGEKVANDLLERASA